MSDAAGRGGSGASGAAGAAADPAFLDGFPASEGIAMGTARLVALGVPDIPAETVGGAAESSRELERFRAALAWARSRLEEIKAETRSRLGAVEARIFDPQLLMLDDPEVVAGTERYILDNRLTAARAFDWRMLELREQWARTSHAMVLDRLNDLQDLKVRVLGRLLGIDAPVRFDASAGAVAVARDLAPSFVARLDPDRTAAIATDRGSRTSHWAILARSLEIPAVVGLGDVSARTGQGDPVIVDGGTGRVVVRPGADQVGRFERRRAAVAGWRSRSGGEPAEGALTRDGHPVALLANLDLPANAARARRNGADGIGLFRTEFLLVGRSAMPGEEEQYRAYRAAAEAFPAGPVLIRTFDVGGDKFPIFLRMPYEENPFLGRRGVRVFQDEPRLFLTQLRAILRAAVHGDVRVMVPMPNAGAELDAARDLLRSAADQLRREGVPFAESIKLGAMIETPAAALNAAELAARADFFSIGTNDLVQYTLAVDRSNTRLAHLIDSFHPSVLRQIAMAVDAARDAGIEVSACGEMAARPIGSALLLGLGVEALSVAWPSLPEVRSLVRAARLSDMRSGARAAMNEPTGDAARRTLAKALRGIPNPRLFPLRP